MKSRDPLLAAWEETLARKRGAPAVLSTRGDVVFTFDQIEKRAGHFEKEMETIRRGEVVAVQIGNHEDWPSLFLACLRKELVVLPLEQSISDRQRDAALKVCGATGLVAAALGGGRNIQVLPMTNSTRPGVAGAATRWRENPPAVLKLTSGTTAEPRAILFQSAQLLADCHQICETMGISDVDLNFGVIPVSHSYGFSNLLTPLIVRGVPMVISRDRTPRAVLEDLARTNATVFPGMPLFYQAFCEIERFPELSKLRLCISAGAPLPSAIARRFFEKFSHAIHSFYGASECGGICYDRHGTQFVDGFVGEPMEGVDIEIVDPGETSSQICVRSPAVADGYFPDDDGDKLGRGVFRPDDLLARTAAGFKIVGRISDVINVAGKKVSPAEVESHLLRFRSVRQAVVFGRESALRHEEVAACVVGDANLREAELLEFCRNGLCSWQVPKRIFIVETIPINERGKVSRRDLAKRFV